VFPCEQASRRTPSGGETAAAVRSAPGRRGSRQLWVRSRVRTGWTPWTIRAFLDDSTPQVLACQWASAQLWLRRSGVRIPSLAPPYLLFSQALTRRRPRSDPTPSKCPGTLCALRRRGRFRPFLSTKPGSISAFPKAERETAPTSTALITAHLHCVPGSYSLTPQSGLGLAELPGVLRSLDATDTSGHHDTIGVVGERVSRMRPCGSGSRGFESLSLSRPTPSLAMRSA
jgi:hypothetical protein